MTSDGNGGQVGRALLLAALGLRIGSAIAGVTTRWLAGQLFGAGATDPATFGAVALLLASAALAGLLPALRAAGAPPMTALRQE